MDKNSVDFTEKELKIAYFFLAKKATLKKILIAFLILLNVLIYSYAVYHFSQYFSQSKEHEKMLKELATPYINYDEINKILSPLPLQIISTKAISIDRSKYNLICQVINPNQKWSIKSLNYKFISSDFATLIFSSFVLPMEEKPLVVFNQTLEGITRDFSCEVTNLSWQRVKPDKSHLLEIPKNFLIKDLKHTPAREENEKDMTVFKFVNQTVYNFWEINLLVVPYQGNEIVGIERFPLAEVMSGQEREVKIIWPNLLPLVSEVKVYSEINVFDQSLFIIPQLKPVSKSLNE